ncbi:MAG: Maf family nucleotide pyrophosphatase [Myxococcota bacterium]|nr:Maf family nucleotide pyrophosphatase [Myxococcota bacterium]
MAPLVLGSASPRRREMIAMLRLPFVVRTADIDERPAPGEAPSAYLRRITEAKLAAVQAGWTGTAAGVLAADTIVVAGDGALLGKPANEAEGAAMIGRLAGSIHEVSTCFVLAGPLPGSEVEHIETVTTRVTFRALSAGEADAYAASGEGADKAGGYALQGAASAFVTRIDGSYTGVIGLPLCEVVVALRALRWM